MTETDTRQRTYYLQTDGERVIVHTELIDGMTQLAVAGFADRVRARDAWANEIKAAEAVRIGIRQLMTLNASEPESSRFNEGVFKSAHEALVFAFTFKSQQFPRTPMTQLLKRGGALSGRGLAGLDGAGQAGMVLREVLALDSDQAAMIVGRFSKPVECPCCGSDAPSADFSEALETLSERVKPLLAGTECNSRVRRELVRRYLKGKVSMTMLATQTGISRSAANDYYARIAKPLAVLEKQARVRLDEALAPMVMAV